MQIGKVVVLNLFREVPLLGALADCKLSDHKESLSQLLVVVGLSMSPIWLGGLIVYATYPHPETLTFLAALRTTVSNGELFMYCTALLAPVFWMALFDPPGARIFPSKLIHMFLIAVIDLIAAVFFGLIEAHDKVNPKFVYNLSTWLFLFSLVLLYLGTVYHTSRLPDPTGEFKRQETDFSTALEAHHQ